MLNGEIFNRTVDMKLEWHCNCKICIYKKVLIKICQSGN